METKSELLKSEDILDEVKRSFRSREVVNVEEERVKVVIFTLGDNRYAFHGRDIREILSGCEVFRVPSLPDFLPGLINVRGDIESAIDLGYLLGGERSTDSKTLIAMAERDGFRSGIIIDAINDVTELPKSSIGPPLATLSGTVRALAAGVIELDGQTATLLDIEKLAAKVTL